MNSKPPTIFAQLMTLIHPETFHRCVQKYGGQERIRSFTCWDQFLCMAFGQLTFRDSLRDTVDCLCARSDRLYQMGFRGPIRRSTLADANEQRDWRMYAHLAQHLIRKARRLYLNEPLLTDLDAVVYALDSTTIDLCLSLFRWAKFRRTKGAIKLHTLLDLRGPIPTFIHISDGKLHDVHALDLIPIEPGAFYVMDRGYLDFKRLHGLHQLSAFFVIRAKRTLKYVRIKSQPIDPSSQVISDQIIRLALARSRDSFPDPLRRVRYFDTETKRFFVYLTNNFSLPPDTVALLYKSRWQVELFFKWIKQHLRIKAFYGVSMNAVKTQIWIAVSVYVLVAILKKQLGLERRLFSILQVLSVSLFEKRPLPQLFSEPDFLRLEESEQERFPLFEFIEEEDDIWL